MQQAGALEVKADAQLGARQRGLAKPAARACGVARKSSDSHLEKRPTLLTNTADEELTMIENRLNHRPRKRLGFKTPYEVFQASLTRVAPRP